VDNEDFSLIIIFGIFLHFTQGDNTIVLMKFLKNYQDMGLSRLFTVTLD